MAGFNPITEDEKGGEKVSKEASEQGGAQTEINQSTRYRSDSQAAIAWLPGDNSRADCHAFAIESSRW
jgi:hypothetical protein